MNLIWNKSLGVNIYFFDNSLISGISQTDWRQNEKRMNILNRRCTFLLHEIAVKCTFKHRQMNKASISLHVGTLATLIAALKMQTHSMKRMLS